MIYNVPLDDQYQIEGDKYFMLHFSSDARLVKGPNGSFLPLTLRDIELNSNNLKQHNIMYLRAIVKHTLNENPDGLNKNKLIELILKDIRL